MDKNELLPCPFCGGKAQIKWARVRNTDTGATAHWVRCESCGATGPFGSALATSAQRIAEAWNRRTGPTFVTPDAALKVAVASDPVVSNPPMGGGRA